MARTGNSDGHCCHDLHLQQPNDDDVFLTADPCSPCTQSRRWRWWGSTRWPITAARIKSCEPFVAPAIGNTASALSCKLPAAEQGSEGSPATAKESLRQSDHTKFTASL